MLHENYRASNGRCMSMSSNATVDHGSTFWAVISTTGAKCTQWSWPANQTNIHKSVPIVMLPIFVSVDAIADTIWEPLRNKCTEYRSRWSSEFCYFLLNCPVNIPHTIMIMRKLQSQNYRASAQGPLHLFEPCVLLMVIVSGWQTLLLSKHHRKH